MISGGPKTERRKSRHKQSAPVPTEFVPRRASMEFEQIKQWLIGCMSKRAQICRMKAILAFAVCPVALTAAAGCVFVLLRLFASSRHTDNGATLGWIALASVPVMFLGNRLTPRGESLMEKRMREGAPLPGTPWNRATVLIRLFLWVIFAGPRLCDWAIAAMREARQWQEQDAPGCAAVLWLLASRHKKVPYEDFQTEIPWLDLPAVLPQVTRISGVLRLQAPPAGLSLTDELRDAIRTGGPMEG